jgi:hypothetical protein
MATSESIAKEKTESPPADPNAIAVNDSKPEQQDATANTDLESASPEGDSAPPARWRTANIILLILAVLFSLSLIFTIIYTIEASAAFRCSHPGLTRYTYANYMLLCYIAFLAVYELRCVIVRQFCWLVILVAYEVFVIRFFEVSASTAACGAGS